MKKTILRIGNNLRTYPRQIQGFSFVEVMVTVSILAFGLVLIYKAFFISLDYTNHITYRIHAVTLLDNIVYQVEQKAKKEKQLPSGNVETVKQVAINNKKVNFEYWVNFTKLKEFDDLFQADISLFWTEGDRKITLSRSFYVPYEKSF